MHDWPEVIFERDKERSVLGLTSVRDARRSGSQQAARSFGESPLWPDAVLLLSHITGRCSFVTPCLGRKAGTPNRAGCFGTDA